jgi:RNA polymerase sigma-70 factor (ECF subfamily)
VNAAEPRARFAAFYATHWRRLWAFLVRLGAEPAAAQDLAQDAFARWALSPAALWDERPARAYLYTIAHRLLIDQHREARRHAVLDAELAAPSSNGDFALAGAWGRLGQKERTLLWLAYAEEFTHDEIASVTGVGAASVKVLLSRAREKARNLLGGQLA